MAEMALPLMGNQEDPYIEGAGNNARPADPQAWTIGDVQSWLHNLNMGAHSAVFAENNVVRGVIMSAGMCNVHVHVMPALTYTVPRAFRTGGCCCCWRIKICGKISASRPLYAARPSCATLSSCGPLARQSMRMRRRSSMPRRMISPPQPTSKPWLWLRSRWPATSAGWAISHAQQPVMGQVFLSRCRGRT